VISLIGAVASLFRGGRYVYDEKQPASPEREKVLAPTA
jgi:hypothetical protein